MIHPVVSIMWVFCFSPLGDPCVGIKRMSSECAQKFMLLGTWWFLQLYKSFPSCIYLRLSRPLF